ncbi:MAG: hypothetical protein CMLOHMNK_03631 [Steroidobacteraceae bacterium]|nr:hypothetical protein [Steroidobacteraceae bacterium]
MKEEFLTPVALRQEGTWAIPPGEPRPKSATFILIAAALTPFNATAATVELPLDPACTASRWTNAGTVLDVARADGAFASAVLEVRRRSGLTWEQLATLFGVDRRSVHLWAAGRPLSAANAERLNRTLALVRRIDRGTPAATRAWLLSPGPDGNIPLDLLRDGRFAQIVMPGPAAVVPRPAPISESSRRARTPGPPEELVGARHERAHMKKGRLIAVAPVKAAKPK